MTTASSMHRSRALRALGAAAAGMLALGGAQAAPAPDPESGRAVAVRYDDLNLRSTQGARQLYRRIVAAARTVCPVEDPRNLAGFQAARTCQAGAIRRAVQQVDEPHLAALYDQTGRG